ncbi:MAG: aldo/keto reductase [Burkholderiaceae bacterium]
MAIRSIRSVGGVVLPLLGLGTWRMGEDRAQRTAEVAAVRTALALGYRLIDTAEMYGEGESERIVGEALGVALREGQVRRDELSIVSKVYPHNATRTGVRAACARSRQRLGLDRIDIYLLHWRGGVPLAETIDALQREVATGSIGAWGVSNFDLADLDEVLGLQGSGPPCVLNQVHHSIAARGVEFDLLPRQRELGMALMAYSPIDQGAIARHPALAALAARRDASAAQFALARLLAQPGVVAIPKAVTPEHLRANLAAATLQLDADEIEAIDRLFPPPRRAVPLSVL